MSDRGELKTVFAPLCEAINNAITENPQLAVYLAEKHRDTLQVRFNTESKPPTVDENRLSTDKSNRK